jgi:hypothetical protein
MPTIWLETYISEAKHCVWPTMCSSRFAVYKRSIQRIVDRIGPDYRIFPLSTLYRISHS